MVVGNEEGAARFHDHIYGAAKGVSPSKAREEGLDALNLAVLEKGYGNL